MRYDARQAPEVLLEFHAQGVEMRQWAAEAIHIAQVPEPTRALAVAILRHAHGIVGAVDAWHRTTETNT